MKLSKNPVRFNHLLVKYHQYSSDDDPVEVSRKTLNTEHNTQYIFEPHQVAPSEVGRRSAALS